MLAVGSCDLVAQNYQSDEVDRSLRTRGQIIKRYVKSPTGDPADAEQFKNFFEKYYFPAMSQASPDGLEMLGRLRTDLFKNYIYASKDSTQKFLSDTAFQWARAKAISGRYHPAVRYNALLILGRIDNEYVGPGAETPTPKPEANDILYRIGETVLRSDNRDRYPQYLLIGALEGMERHARYLDKLPNKQKSQTVNLLGKTLMSGPAGDYEPEIRDWVFTQAAQGLANTGTVGQRSAYLRAITKRIADEEVDLDTRITLASLLKEMQPKSGDAGADAAVNAIKELAFDVAKRENEIAKKFDQLSLRGGGRNDISTERSDISTRVTIDEDRQYALNRSTFLDPLKKLDFALDAAEVLASDTQKDEISKIKQAYSDATSQLADSEVTDLNATLALRTMYKDLEVMMPVEEASDEENLDAFTATE